MPNKRLWWRRSIPPKPDKPDLPWFILKMGGFEEKCSKTSAQAITPALPIVLRFIFGWVISPAVTFLLLLKGGGVDIQWRVCQQPPIAPTPTLAEGVSPQTKGVER